MATYIFTTPGKFKKDSGATHASLQRGSNDFIELNPDDTVSYRIGPYSGSINPATDSITIDGAAFAGTAAELQDALIAVFPNPEGSGSTTPVILQSPDGSLWLVTVNNSGVLQTQLVESGTPSELFLYSPDGTRWEVTVNNEGALTTTAV